MTILRTVEQRKATKACEKYLYTKDQCSPLRNKGVTHAHITCLPSRLCHKYLLNSRVACRPKLKAIFIDVLQKRLIEHNIKTAAYFYLKHFPMMLMCFEIEARTFFFCIQCDI
jgi:hypothetical protein